MGPCSRRPLHQFEGSLHWECNSQYTNRCCHPDTAHALHLASPNKSHAETPVERCLSLGKFVSARLNVLGTLLTSHSVIFTSIYRFTTLFQFVPSDLTWTLAKACTWCIVESSAGIVSACLPTLAPLLRGMNVSSWRKHSTSPSSSNNKGSELVTIGGSGCKGSRFERLDETILV